LPTVRNTPLFHTSEILSSPSVRAIFDELRATYDYVVVDLPPLSPIVDVRATTHLVDSYLLVVEWGRTSIDVVTEGLRSAPQIYDGLMGAILNKADMRSIKRYGSHRATLYDNKHYSRYGYTG
jgi:Mrp family chromosome partitioning ATPase